MSKSTFLTRQEQRRKYAEELRRSLSPIFRYLCPVHIEAVLFGRLDISQVRALKELNDLAKIEFYSEE
jgi:hypothetical protein